MRLPRALISAMRMLITHVFPAYALFKVLFAFVKYYHAGKVYWGIAVVRDNAGRTFSTSRSLGYTIRIRKPPLRAFGR